MDALVWGIRAFYLHTVFMDTKQKFKKLLGHNVRRDRVDRRFSVEKLGTKLRQDHRIIQQKQGEYWKTLIDEVYSIYIRFKSKLFRIIQPDTE